MQANVEYKWEDVKVSDIITVELPYIRYFFLGPRQITGEVVDTMDIEQLDLGINDPLVLREITDVYAIRIRTGEEEYTVTSTFWKLINIEERKDKMEEQVAQEKQEQQQLKVGDVVSVISNNVKGGLGFPKDEELIAEVVRYDNENHILIHSKQLEDLGLGHDGEKPHQFPKKGCWWVYSHNLRLVKREPESEFDIFI